MKTRNLVGGVVVISFLAGGYLSGLFPKFGVGTGGAGNGTGPGTMDNKVEQHASVEVSPRTEESPEETPQIVGDMAHDPRVLDVRLDGRSFEVLEHQDGSQRYRQVELPALIDLAKSKVGNEQGIKVRIQRMSSSRASAEEALKQALLDAGISQDAIAWESVEAPIE